MGPLSFNHNSMRDKCSKCNNRMPFWIWDSSKHIYYTYVHIHCMYVRWSWREKKVSYHQCCKILQVGLVSYCTIFCKKGSYYVYIEYLNLRICFCCYQFFTISLPKSENMHLDSNGWLEEAQGGPWQQRPARWPTRTREALILWMEYRRHASLGPHLPCLGQVGSNCYVGYIVSET